MTKTPRPAWISRNLNADTNDLIRPLAITLALGVIALASCTMAQSAPVTCDMRGCSDWKGSTSTVSKSSRARISQSTDAHGNAVVIGGRPAGCPRAHCGCSTSLYIFGKIKPELNLAANWLKFPRTSPSPRMVAARRGHVMVLLSHVEGNDWLTYDPNSGGGLTRQHVRSIRGYRVVNPHGAYAEN